MSHGAQVFGDLGKQLLLGLSAAGLVAVGSYIYLQSDTLSSRYLAGFALVTTFVPLGRLVEIGLAGQHTLLLTSIVHNMTEPVSMAIGLVGGMVFWLAFVLSYTAGIGKRDKWLLGVGGTAAVALTFGLMALRALEQGGFSVAGAPSESMFRAAAFIAVLLTMGIIGYGGMRLFRAASAGTNTTVTEASLLTLGGGWWATSLFGNLVFGVSTTESEALGVLVTVGALTAAVVRLETLERIPASRLVGRETAVDEIDSAIVVLDPEGTVIDANDATEALFDRSRGATVGELLDDLLPATADTAAVEATGETVFELPASSRILRAQTSTTTDDSGRELGRAVVFHDITTERRRQQRIQVLNRVLRHNLRNDMNVVNGYAEELAAMTVDLQEYPDRIQDTAEELIALGEKAREIEQVVATDGDQATPLSELLSALVADRREAYPACTFRVDDPDEAVRVEGTVVTAVLGELLENAARHNDSADPQVTVTATVDYSREYPIEVTVSDNGPGIPEHELRPIREGQETDLEHGSGLGLWLVEWGVVAVDGAVEFDPNEPEGTTVRLSLPSAG